MNTQAGALARLATLAAVAMWAAAGPAHAAEPLRLQAFGDPAELNAYKELIAAFKAATPGVEVEFIPVGKQRDHMAKLATGFSGGNPPDLFLINFRRFGQFAAKGVLEPLGPSLAARGKFREADFYEQATEAFRYNGQLMCTPQNVSSLVTYYNVAMFKQLGLPLPTADWDWAAFMRAAKALTRDTNGDGKTDVYGLGFEPTLIRLVPFVWQAGGDLVDNLAAPKRFTLDTPAALEALEFVRSWSTSKVVPPLVDNKSEDHESRFARGGLGMVLHSRRYTATLRGVPNLDWDVAPLPRHKQAATVLHADAYCMAKGSANKDAAFRFVEFALGDVGAGIVARSGRTVPAKKSVAQSADFLDSSQRPRSAKVFLDSIAQIRRTPNIAQWNEIETRAEPLVEDWYFHPGTPKSPLQQDVSLATQNLLGRAAKP
jgi:multiple sugar transport system substrate-binding protein